MKMGDVVRIWLESRISHFTKGILHTHSAMMTMVTMPTTMMTMILKVDFDILVLEVRLRRDETLLLPAGEHTYR